MLKPGFHLLQLVFPVLVMASLSLGFLLLCCSLLGFCLLIQGEEVDVQLFDVSLHSLLPKAVCSSPSGRNHTGLKIVHWHGPCLPINKRQKPTAHEILQQDVYRVRSLQSRQLSTLPPPENLRGSLTTIPARLGRSLGTANYVVTLGLGTPKQDLSMVFDTGSDLTWVQCEPCVGYCYQQQEPIFDPTQSSSYYNISCTAAECPLLKSATGSPGRCSGSTCVYAIQYGDNSYSVGFFTRDTLTLTSSDVFPNFKFGCGQKNRGLFGRSAGLLGLGRDKVSVVSQSSEKYGGVFSYCLPSSASSVGYLNFGDDANAASSTAKLTPMLSDSNMSSFYFVNLIAISVGGRQLRISPSVFSTPGTLIDSGTVITRLPPTAYSALRSAFRRVMSKYRKAPALSILDTCYDFTGHVTVSLPTVSLHFGGGADRGADLNIDPSGILFVANVSQACLAFAGNSDPGNMAIIGNMQQQTYNVIYDTSSGVIGFAAGGCS